MRKFWTDEEIAEVTRRYPLELTEDIARDMGKSLVSIYNFARKNHLTKNPGVIERGKKAKPRDQREIYRQYRLRKKEKRDMWRQFIAWPRPVGIDDVLKQIRERANA